MSVGFRRDSKPPQSAPAIPTRNDLDGVFSVCTRKGLISDPPAGKIYQLAIWIQKKGVAMGLRKFTSGRVSVERVSADVLRIEIQFKFPEGVSSADAAIRVEMHDPEQDAELEKLGIKPDDPSISIPLSRDDATCLKRALDGIFDAIRKDERKES